MSTIKIIKYTYKDYEVGEVVDLGEEKNTSMVSFQRAVWWDNEEKEIKDGIVKTTATEPEEDNTIKEDKGSEDEATNGKKEILQNKTKNQIIKKKESTSKKKSAFKGGFWDKLK